MRVKISQSYFPKEITNDDISRTYICLIENATVNDDRIFKHIVWIKEITKDTPVWKIKDLIQIVDFDSEYVIVSNIDNPIIPYTYGTR